MYHSFLKHQLKKHKRLSTSKEKFVQIILTGFVFITLLYALLLGLMLEKIIIEHLHSEDPIAIVNSVLLYYFATELLSRYFLQPSPVPDIQPYLHLPIGRAQLIHFTLGKSIVHFMNLLVVLIFLPFAMGAVAKVYGTLAASAWIISLIGVSISLHYFLILFKKSIDSKPYFLFVLFTCFAAAVFLDYYHWLSFSSISALLFQYILTFPIIAIALIALPVLSYTATFRFYKTHTYVEELSNNSRKKHIAKEWTLLQKVGMSGKLIQLELKLIARHKRTKPVFTIGIPFLLCMCIMAWNIKDSNAYSSFLFIGILATGMVAMNYGQFLFSWQASHFDFQLTRPIPLRQFINSKYIFLTAVTIICSIPGFVLALFHPVFVLVIIVTCLYNIGINNIIMMNLTMWGASKIDLDANGTLNYEGLGAAQWILGIPLLAGPYLFFIPFSLFGNPMAGLVAVGIAGLTGIILKNFLLDFTTKRLKRDSYEMASNFVKK